MKREFISSSPAQTKKFANVFAKELSSSHRSLALLLGAKLISKELSSPRGALIIVLSGELGSGKTTFLQGLAKGLGIKEKILSPTFVIIKKFKINNSKLIQNLKSTLRGVHFASSKIKNFYHIDCYRIQKPKELLDLNFKELSSNPQNIIVIEWPEKIKKLLPKSTIWIYFKFIKEKTRKISIPTP